MYVNPTTKDMPAIAGDVRDNGLTNKHIEVLAERADELGLHALVELCNLALLPPDPGSDYARMLVSERLATWDDDAEDRAARDRARAARERLCSDPRRGPRAAHSSAAIWAESERRRDEELLDIEALRLFDESR